jgi:hypothetical protein
MAAVGSGSGAQGMPGKTGRKSVGVLAELKRVKVKSFEACPGLSTAAMRWRPAGARATVARTEGDSGEKLQRRPEVGGRVGDRVGQR